MPSFAADLASLKRNARLRGRGVTQQEVAGVTAGRAISASERLAKAKGIALQEENIGVQREGIASQERMSGAEISSREKLAADDMSLKRQLQELDLKSRADLQQQSLSAESSNLATRLAAEKQLQQINIDAQSKWRGEDRVYDAEWRAKEFAQRQYETEVEKQSAKKARRSCIIITACTSPTSYEVEIARMFRDDFLTDNTLGGYYALCEIVVPLIDRFKTIRKAVKRLLVDRFIDFAEVVYCKKRKHNLRYSEPVTMVFLAVCGIIGKFIDTEKWIKLHR